MYVHNNASNLWFIAVSVCSLCIEAAILMFTRGAVTAAAGLATAYAYVRAKWPRLDVPTKSRTKVREVGACRLRLRGSVACQVYFPTLSCAEDCLPSYPYYRDNVMDAQQSAVGIPRAPLDFLGLASALSPCLTSLKDRPGNPPPDVAIENHSPREKRTDTKNLPVILFSHGLFGHCDIHCVISRQLAKQGYIVIILEHEGGNASYCFTENGVQIPYNHPRALTVEEKEDYSTIHNLIREFRGPILSHRVGEVKKAIQCLRDGLVYPLHGRTGKPLDSTNSNVDSINAAEAHCRHLLSCMDLERMHIAGHSFGGATAILAMQSTQNLPGRPFKSCLLFDPWVEALPQASLDQGMADAPTFTICSGAWGCAPRVKFFKQIKHLLCSQQISTKSTVAVMPGTLHSWVADIPFWMPWWLAKVAKRAGDVDPEVAINNTVNAACDFLRGTESGSPSWVSRRGENEAHAHGIEWI